jgi:hypothetical protein
MTPLSSPIMKRIFHTPARGLAAGMLLLTTIEQCYRTDGDNPVSI